MIKACVVCEKDFEVTHRNRRLCSDACREEKARQMSAAYAQIKAQKQGRRVGWYTCKDCGAEKERKIRALGRKGSPRCGNAIRCDECRRIWLKIFSSVTSHFTNIVVLAGSKDQKPGYVGMPFFEGWNPRVGGSFQAATGWIKDNIGQRPDDTTLHIVDHIKGFVPNNLAWSSPRKQNAEQMFKIITAQRLRIKELEDEVKRLRSKTIAA